MGTVGIGYDTIQCSDMTFISAPLHFSSFISCIITNISHHYNYSPPHPPHLFEYLLASVDLFFAHLHKHSTYSSVSSSPPPSKPCLQAPSEFQGIGSTLKQQDLTIFIAVYTLIPYVSLTPIKLQRCFTLYILLHLLFSHPMSSASILPTSEKSSPNSPKYSLSCLTHVFGLSLLLNFLKISASSQPICSFAI